MLDERRYDVYKHTADEHGQHVHTSHECIVPCESLKPEREPEIDYGEAQEA